MLWGRWRVLLWSMVESCVAHQEQLSANTRFQMTVQALDRLLDVLNRRLRSHAKFGLPC